MFFDYYTKMVEEQQKIEPKLKKARKLAKKKLAEVFEDSDEKETSETETETEQIEEKESGE